MRQRVRHVQGAGAGAPRGHERRLEADRRVIDPIGVQAAIDHKLPLAVLDGREIERIADALAGNSFIGTLIEVD